MSELRPLKWLWGLLPLSLIVALVLLGLAPQIESDLLRRTESALQEADISWATAIVQGRDVTLRGEAVGQEARDAALEAAAGVWGIRKLEDQISLLERANPYTWWANREEGRIRIKGYVPDGRDRHTILGIVKALMPELEIDDRMKRAAGSPPREMWVGSISYALNLLAQVKGGTASLENSRLSLMGEAVSAEAYATLRERLDTQLPAGLELNKIELTPPVAAPFVWSAQFESGALTLGGHVPSEDARSQVAKGAKELFGAAAVLDRMEIASGAPEKWTEVVLTALTQLSRLQSGKIELSDTALAFQGQAADQPTASDVAAKVRLGLPAVYKSSEEVTHDQRSPSQRSMRAPISGGSQQAESEIKKKQPDKQNAAPM